MKFTLKTPCKDCPFRRDVPGYIHPERAEEITRAVLREDQTFTCHKQITGEQTEDGDGYVPGANDIHCAGALILHQKQGWSNFMLRLAAMTGLFKPDELDMDAPVFDTAQEMIDHMK